MKKNVILLLTLTLVPYLLCMVFSLFSDEVRIGQGNDSLKYHLMGKEILIELNGLYKSMDVEEYVLGVLAGTISAEYDMEALKVQAILIRTNVLKEMEEKGTTDAADLSYQYLTMEDRKFLFGDLRYEKYENRFEQAVVDTAGQVIRKEDSLIMALYHEVSIGKTVSAQEILGEDISYLQSVESSQDVQAKHYMSIVPYTWEELQAIENGTQTSEEGQSAEAVSPTSEAAGEEGAGAVSPTSETASEEGAGAVSPTSGAVSEEGAGAVSPTSEATGEEGAEAVSPTPEAGTGMEATDTSTVPDTSSGENRMDIQITESTENGFVKQLSVNGTIYTGEEAMERYGLASTNFYVEEIDGGIRFVCLGKGNCMGLSQYGANVMALSGKEAEEIIKYYYPGVSLETYQ